MRSCIPDSHEQLLSILESEEEAQTRKVINQLPLPQTASNGRRAWLVAERALPKTAQDSGVE
jgi:hypothetical protein